MYFGKQVWVDSWISDRYLVSNWGNVYDLKKGRLLSLTPDRAGYLRCKIVLPSGRKTVSVHRLVAGSFYDADISKYEVNHIDGVKTNNHIANLELVDRSENMLHAFRNGLAKPVVAIRMVECVETGEVFNSISSAARAYHVDPSGICDVLHGRQKTAAKMHWIERR